METAQLVQEQLYNPGGEHGLLGAILGGGRREITYPQALPLLFQPPPPLILKTHPLSIALPFL